MTQRCAIFIDGGYLDVLLRDTFAGTRISYEALSRQMAGDAEMLRTYYYHCPMFQSIDPTENERRAYAAQQRFFGAMEELPRFALRLGRLARRGPDGSGGYRYEQKMVDILLGVDLVLLSAKRIISEAIVLAGDTDFVPAIHAAKGEGVLVRLYHGPDCHADLRREADERVPITQELIDAVSLPTSGQLR